MGAPSGPMQLYFVYVGETLVGPALARSEEEAIEKIIGSTPWVRPHRSSLKARLDRGQGGDEDDHDQESAFQTMRSPSRLLRPRDTGTPGNPPPTKLEKECFCYEITNNYHIHLSDCPNHSNRGR